MKWQFEILKGLPATGPLPLTFSYGPGRHTEGYVVRFFSDREELTWVGNFISGGYRLSSVIAFNSGTGLAVIAGGVLYLINPERRSLVIEPIFGVLKCKDLHETFLLLDMGGITKCVTASGLRWETFAYIPEDIFALKVEGNTLSGKAGDGYSGKYDQIALNLESGEIQILH